MQESQIQAIRRAVPALTVRTGVPFREVTSFGVGGVIPYLAEPADDLQLSALFRVLRAEKIPYLLIGGGSNLAGMDAAFDGIAIRLIRGAFSAIGIGRSCVTAGAAIRMAELARSAAQAGFGGLAALAGIPGTLGGALRMNAGTRQGGAIGERVVQLCGCRTDGSIWSAEAGEIAWDYRHASIPDDVVITSAILRLPHADPAAELQKIDAELAARRDREPQGRTAGCIFRNPSPDEPAGRLVDLCGLKGSCCGELSVSERHANFIVNRDAASEAELLDLMIRIRGEVARTTGIYLEPEVVFLNPDTRRRLLEAVPAPHVAVLMGGDSSEREVSLRSGAAVAGALRRAGLTVTEVDLRRCEVTPEMLAADVVFPILHGGFGEDGRIQREMEAHNIAFVGSGSVACDLVMDKIATKRLLDRLRLPTAPWGIVTPDRRQLPEGLSFPVVVKAPRQGSTVGIVKVERAEDWDAALDAEFQYDTTLLVEAFVKGTEISVPIVNGQVLPVVEIRSPHGFYDYDAKYVYKSGHTMYFCPAETVPDDRQREAGELTRRFFEAAGCRDLLRVDFIIDGDGRPCILEGNALPGCTETSLVPKAARVAGISFERLTAALVRAALLRREAR